MSWKGVRFSDWVVPCAIEPAPRRRVEEAGIWSRGPPRSRRPGAPSAHLALGAPRQLVLAYLALLADVRRRPGDDALHHLEQHDGLRLVDLEVEHRVRLDENQRETRIVGPAVAVTALVAEPGAPVGLVQLANQLAIARDGRRTRHRDPLARPILVVREVH